MSDSESVEGLDSVRGSGDEPAFTSRAAPGPGRMERDQLRFCMWIVDAMKLIEEAVYLLGVESAPLEESRQRICMARGTLVGSKPSIGAASPYGAGMAERLDSIVATLHEAEYSDDELPALEALERLSQIYAGQKSAIHVRARIRRSREQDKDTEDDRGPQAGAVEPEGDHGGGA